MRRHRRRPTAPPPVPHANDNDRSPIRWDRVGVGIEVFGFGVLLLAGVVAAAGGAIHYVSGWS